MALVKERRVDKIEIVQDIILQVRYRDVILEDGVEIASKFIREVITPIVDVSQKDQKIKDICAVLYTPEVIAEHIASLDQGV